MTQVRESGWDESKAPVFCPLCGRRLEQGGWDSVDGNLRFEYLCCFKGSLFAWWARRFKITEPLSAHYIYALGSHPTPQTVQRFDRQTGKPL